jgi:hypothetical protein
MPFLFTEVADRFTPVQFFPQVIKFFKCSVAPYCVLHKCNSHIQQGISLSMKIHSDICSLCIILYYIEFGRSINCPVCCNESAQLV